MVASKPKVRMVDVAGHAEVSITTVSLVLNNRPNVNISEATRERVLHSARKMGYSLRPSVARSVSSPRRLFLFMEDLSANPIGITLVNGVRRAAADNQYLLYTVMDFVQEPLQSQLHQLENEQPAGIIIATSYTREIEIPEEFSKWPVILLNCWSMDNLFPSILPNDHDGALRAVRHLLNEGLTRIACIAGELWIPAFRERLDGWRQALSEHSLKPDMSLVKTGTPHVRCGYDETLELLQQPNPPEAIFCFNDWIALGSYQAVQSMGLRIPDDITIVGYDNQRFTADLQPGLTTVELPYDEMGQRAVDILLNSLSSIGTSRVLVDNPLIKRQSVRLRNHTSSVRGQGV